MHLLKLKKLSLQLELATLGQYQQALQMIVA